MIFFFFFSLFSFLFVARQLLVDCRREVSLWRVVLDTHRKPQAVARMCAPTRRAVGYCHVLFGANAETCVFTVRFFFLFGYLERLPGVTRVTESNKWPALKSTCFAQTIHYDRLNARLGLQNAGFTVPARRIVHVGRRESLGMNEVWQTFIQANQRQICFKSRASEWLGWH